MKVESYEPAAEKPLFVPLKTAYFRAFQTGTKDTEFRPYGPRWNERTCRIGRPVILSHGYGRRERLFGTIRGFSVSSEATQTEAWRDCYGPLVVEAACIGIELDAVAAKGLDSSRVSRGRTKAS